MKESSAIKKYIKANADSIGINPGIFDQYDVHIHVPVTSKDGPSAEIICDGFNLIVYPAQVEE